MPTTSHVILVGGLDVAELAFYLFFGFFLCLVIYLRREDRREGYPLEDEVTGRAEVVNAVMQFARIKTFKMPFGRPDTHSPNKHRDALDVNARRAEPFRGSPLVPNGDPMLAGVGPGSYANRRDEPDLNLHGEPRIVPMSSQPGVVIERRDPDPRGATVVGCDGATAGTVSDIWMDTADVLARYLEVDTGSRKVLVPMTAVSAGNKLCKIDAITAAQFANIPGIANAATITKLEEERIVAYFGAGYLYATPSRQEPLI